MLIENGILVGYMHDRLSAKHFGVEPSGNGRRESFRAMPLPRMTSTSLLRRAARPRRDHRRPSSAGSTRSGSAAARSTSRTATSCSRLSESYLIEDGKLTAPLKGVNLIGNGPDVLRRVDMLGNDFQLSDGIWTCGKDGQSVPVASARRR